MTNRFTFTCAHTYALGLSALSTLNNCVGFPTGLVMNTYTTQTGTYL